MESEFNINSRMEESKMMGAGRLDMKRICEEIQENDSETTSQ